MKAIVFLALLGLSYGAEEGWNQRKSLLVLKPVITQTNGPDFNQRITESTEEVNRAVMEKLRAGNGAQTGSYYVYLPDGRLQKVEYTTAPLVSAQQKQASDDQSYVQLPPRFHYVKDVEGKFAKVQKSAGVSDLYSGASDQQKTSERLTSSTEKKQANGYVASVQYSNVDPINGPVYSYDPSPLVRIVRYAENY